MRFKSSSHPADTPAWVVWVVIIVSAPFWVPVCGMLWADEKLRNVKRRWLGPRVGEWQRWFAWRPVRLDNGWGDLVWLEPVYRQSYGYGVAYVLDLPDPEDSHG